jgi:RimJ/RimL family protein N-acetyltransferase
MEFRPITERNRAYVNRIFAGDKQQYWVHCNWYWDQNSQRIADIACRLIYVDSVDEPVGIIAYGQHYADEDLAERVPGVYEVIHMVIDVKYQGRGYGRAATQRVIQLLQQQPDCWRIVIAHHPDNIVAQRLYQSLGFVPFAHNYDGDPLLKLDGAN